MDVRADRTRISRWHMKILWKSNQPHRSINKRNRYNILRGSGEHLFGWNDGNVFHPFQRESYWSVIYTETNKSQILCISSYSAKPKELKLKGVFVAELFRLYLQEFAHKQKLKGNVAETNVYTQCSKSVSAKRTRRIRERAKIDIRNL